MEERKNNSSYMIANLAYDKDKINVWYYDGREDEEPFSAHNLHFYRNRWMNQLKDVCSGELSLAYDIQSKAIKHFLWGTLRHIVEFFLLYNLDIHIVMKVIILILILGVQHKSLKELSSYLGVMDVPVRRLETLLMYINNASLFEYEGNDEEFHYSVAIDDVVNKYLTFDMIDMLIHKFYYEKKQNSDLESIKIPFWEERNKMVDTLHNDLDEANLDELEYDRYMYRSCELIDDYILKKCKKS